MQLSGRISDQESVVIDRHLLDDSTTRVPHRDERIVVDTPSQTLRRVREVVSDGVCHRLTDHPTGDEVFLATVLVAFGSYATCETT